MNGTYESLERIERLLERVIELLTDDEPEDVVTSLDGAVTSKSRDQSQTL